MKENWKDIEGYEGKYQVSDLGRIKSLARIVIDTWGIGRQHNINEKVLKQRMTNCGYSKICLLKQGEKKYPNIHRLVAQAFIPNPENKQTVNHKDRDRMNNNKSNLEWMTQSENVLHAHTCKINKQ